MSLRNFSMVAGLLVTGVLMACVSTEETAQGPQYKYPTETSFCAALAKAECNAEVVKACYSTSNEANNGACVSARSALGACRASVTGVDNPGVASYNPVAAEGCIAKHKSVFADAELTTEELEAANEACIKVFTGPGTAGSTCGVDVDCNTGKNLRCVIKSGAAGTCAEPRDVEKGDDCQDAAAQCPDDYFCGEAVSGSICQAKVPAGNTTTNCSADVPCADDAKCDVDMTTKKGLCVQKFADGESCTADAECSGSFCEKDKDTNAGTCASVYQITRYTHSCDGFKQ